MKRDDRWLILLLLLLFWWWWRRRTTALEAPASPASTEGASGPGPQSRPTSIVVDTGHQFPVAIDTMEMPPAVPPPGQHTGSSLTTYGNRVGDFSGDFFVGEESIMQLNQWAYSESKDTPNWSGWGERLYSAFLRLQAEGADTTRARRQMEWVVTNHKMNGP